MQLFDRILWRINGIILLLCICALVTLIAWGLAWEFAYDRKTPKARPGIIQVNQETQVEERLQLGRFMRVEGSTHYIAPLYAAPHHENNYVRSHSVYSGWPVRNYIFYDPDTSTSWWLFASHTSVILEKNAVLKNPQATEDKETIGYIFTTVDTDTDGDGEKTRGDLHSIWCADARGKNLQHILSDVHDVQRVIQHDTETVLITFFNEGRYHVLQLSTDFATHTQKEVPLVTKQ